MWFKQLRFFELSGELSFTTDYLEEQLATCAFKKCSALSPTSHGWVNPIDPSDDENTTLVHSANGVYLLAMQIEEKVLPATVVRQQTADEINKIAKMEQRKVYSKEKAEIKERIIDRCLPQAFSKFAQVYAYIDPKAKMLYINTTQKAKLNKFFQLFHKTFTEIECNPISFKLMPPIMTNWLFNDEAPKNFAIMESCVFKDPDQQGHVARFKQQDLTSKAIKALFKEGFEVRELTLAWKDRMVFTLTDEFTVNSIRFEDSLKALAKEDYVESPEAQRDADFVIMTGTLNPLVDDLLTLFKETKTSKSEAKPEENADLASA